MLIYYGLPIHLVRSVWGSFMVHTVSFISLFILEPHHTLVAKTRTINMPSPSFAPSAVIFTHPCSSVRFFFFTGRAHAHSDDYMSAYPSSPIGAARQGETVPRLHPAISRNRSAVSHSTCCCDPLTFQPTCWLRIHMHASTHAATHTHTYIK